MWMSEWGLMDQMLEVDHTGFALLEGLKPGRYTLKSYPDDFVFEPATFELRDQQSTVGIRWSMR